MDLAGDGLNQAAQKVCGRLAHHLLVQFDESELRGPVDRDDEIELVGDVDMEVANRRGPELARRRGFAFDLRKPRDPVALQAAMQRRARPGLLRPVRRSEIDFRAFHLATVFGLTPNRLASALRLSRLCCIARRTASAAWGGDWRRRHLSARQSLALSASCGEDRRRKGDEHRQLPQFLGGGGQ